MTHSSHYKNFIEETFSPLQLVLYLVMNNDCDAELWLDSEESKLRNTELLQNQLIFLSVVLKFSCVPDSQWWQKISELFEIWTERYEDELYSIYAKSFIPQMFLHIFVPSEKCMRTSLYIPDMPQTVKLTAIASLPVKLCYVLFKSKNNRFFLIQVNFYTLFSNNCFSALNTLIAIK